MGLRIQNNVEAFNTHRQLTATGVAASKSMEKLSSGYRINRAADDAAGLAISEKMRGQIGGLAQAQRNAQDGISLVQTAEGALTEVHSMLQRVRDLQGPVRERHAVSTDDKDAIARRGQRSSPSEITTIRDQDEVQRQGPAQRHGRDLTFQVGANDSRRSPSTASDISGRRRRHGRARPTSPTATRRRRRASAPALDARRRSTPRSRTSRRPAPTSARCRTVSSTV